MKFDLEKEFEQQVHEEELIQENEVKHKKFLEKRQQHYKNEFLKTKE